MSLPGRIPSRSEPPGYPPGQELLNRTDVRVDQTLGALETLDQGLVQIGIKDDAAAQLSKRCLLSRVLVLDQEGGADLILAQGSQELESSFKKPGEFHIPFIVTPFNVSSSREIGWFVVAAAL